MFTRRDPYVNLLRGTIAGFAAILGLRFAPFSAVLAGVPELRALIEEAKAAKVFGQVEVGGNVDFTPQRLADSEEVDHLGGLRHLSPSGAFEVPM